MIDLEHPLDTFIAQHNRLRASHTLLLAAAKYAVVVLEDFESAGTTNIGSVIADLLIAIAAAEESEP